ncbi:hypothetical protein [Lysinibacillus xylanilyticus]|uniref:hypothetical protein n=1 Tax=Lysinibacillus xylanilyticus TaxID=582475 RepID=UPI0036DE8AE2
MNELIIETVISYNKYLNQIIDGCNSIVNKIKTDNFTEALQMILQFSEGVEWLAEVNEKLAHFGYQNQMSMEKNHEFLEQINSGLEIQDFILIADIFEYEIKPFFENCKPYEVPSNN